MRIREIAALNKSIDSIPFLGLTDNLSNNPNHIGGDDSPEVVQIRDDGMGNIVVLATGIYYADIIQWDSGYIDQTSGNINKVVPCAVILSVVPSVGDRMLAYQIGHDIFNPPDKAANFPLQVFFPVGGGGGGSADIRFQLEEDITGATASTSVAVIAYETTNPATGSPARVTIYNPLQFSGSNGQMGFAKYMKSTNHYELVQIQCGAG